MSRKIAVDIGDADERYCNGCQLKNVSCTSYTVDQKSNKAERCQACIDAEIKPPVVSEIFKEEMR